MVRNTEIDRKTLMIDDEFAIDPVIATLSQEEVDKLFEKRFGTESIKTA